nr:hypothetical protein [Oscillospiraceae bacterium]
ELAQMAVKGLAAVSRVTGKEPLLSEFNIYMLNRNNEYDCSKAERELGFHCRPFSESIQDTVNWLREEGFLKTPENAEVIEISPVAVLSLLFKKLRHSSMTWALCSSSRSGQRRREMLREFTVTELEASLSIINVLTS